MKRALSLLLTLAMVMSLFTTAAFAAGAQDSTKDSTIKSSDVVHADKLPVKYGSGTATVYYVGTSAPALAGKLSVTGADSGSVSVDGDKLTYYKSGNPYTMKVVAQPVTFTVEKKDVTGTVISKDANAKKFYFMGASAVTAASFDVKSAVSGVTVGSVTVDGSAIKAAITVDGASNPTMTVSTGYTVQEKTYVAPKMTYKVPGDFTLTPAQLAEPVKTILSGITFNEVTLSSTYNNALTVSGGKISCVNAKTLGSNTGVTATFVGGGYTVIVPLEFSKPTTNFTVSLTNGSTVSYTDAVLKELVKSKLGSEAVTSVNVTVPASTSYFEFYVNGSSTKTTAAQAVAMSSSTSLVVKANAGYIGTIKVPYTAIAGGKTYEGEITFSSEYGSAVEVTQYASFYQEEFMLDAISGIYSLSTTVNATVPSGYSDYYGRAAFLVSPSGRSSNWKQEYTGYDNAGVARKVTVTFVPSSYDMISYVEDNVSPFDFEVFGDFAEAVCAEQDINYAVSAEYVQFPTVSSSKWTLKKGGTAIKGTDKFTASTLGSVTLDVTTAGYYDIPFNVYYNYKSESSSVWTTNATVSYQGLIRVYAALDGDIKYEVSYGETVKFNSADFTRLYKKLAGNSYTMSSMVVDELPLYGTLYRDGKVSNSYLVDTDDVFYVNTTNANNSYDLSGLTYWASRAYTDEYSVYVPVTMYGTGGYETAVVEIVVNGGMPFTDVAKNSTFYDYIRYAYNHGIMNGKTATSFDAKSNISRVQLVTTLYRMAGSPATYNGITLPFADTKGLSTEFTNAVKWAYSKGIITGVTATKFAPTDAVTRQAMVTILYRYAKTYGMDVGVYYDNHLASYTDGAKVSSSMVAAMNWAVDYGFVSGNGSKLNPSGSTTRGAAAKILSNFHAFYIG